MKKLIKNIRALNQIRKHGAMLQIVADIFKFVDTTHKEKKPMVTEIAIIDMNNGQKIDSFVSLWAGIGAANPIERCRSLKAQNLELQRLLRLYRNNTISGSDIKSVDLAITTFE